MTRRVRIVSGFAVALIVLGGGTGCVGPWGADPRPSPTPGWPEDRYFDANDFDVCGRADLTPLDKYSVKPPTKSPRKSPDMAECKFDMDRTPAGTAALTLRARTVDNPDNMGFRFEHEELGVYADTAGGATEPVSDILRSLGDEARAISQTSESCTSYAALVRKGNLLASSYLRVCGSQPTYPVSNVALTAVTILESFLKLVPLHR